MTPTIAAGYVSPDALAFLQLHQVPIIECEGLSVIHLDRMVAGINVTARPLEFVISFWLNDTEVEPDCLLLSLNADASESKLVLKKGYWPQFEREEGPIV